MTDERPTKEQFLELPETFRKALNRPRDSEGNPFASEQVADLRIARRQRKIEAAKAKNRGMRVINGKNHAQKSSGVGRV